MTFGKAYIEDDFRQLVLTPRGDANFSGELEDYGKSGLV
jgi:hypothetical protein